MSASRILVVDDDPKIRSLLREVFEGDGYVVDEASDAAKALGSIDRRPPDLVTLDLRLGADDGFEVARRIRAVSKIPIIMVTGKGDVVDRVVGLELGADDYITKPFHVREVLARVKTVLRRATPPLPGDASSAQITDALTAQSPVYRFDGLTAVPDRFEVFDRDGQLCDLTSGDFRLLSVFLQNAKRVLSRDRLMDLTGGTEWSPLDRTIDNQVARLRKKIERDPTKPQIIKTVRGVGYSFACEVERGQSAPSASNA